MLLRYAFRKLLYGSGILFGVVSLIFFLFNVIPGDPARMALGQRSDSASVAAVRADLGLDQPLHIQYFKYLNDLSPLSVYNIGNNKSFFYLNKNIYTNTFGLSPAIKNWQLVLKPPYLRRSFQNQRNVSEILAAALPPTILLALFSIVFASLIGIGLGIIAALNHNRWPDRIMLIISSLGMSLPSFFAAILIGWIFAFLLGKYTGLELTGSLFEIDDYGEGYKIMLKNIILPTLTLGIRPLSVVMQLTRNSLLDVLSQDYIRTARAKGLSQFAVVWRHALKNAMNPVVTSISGWFASMLAGVIFIEYIFAWKGLGYVMVNALQNFDLPVVMGSVILISVFFIVINLLADIVYGMLDPRIKLQ